MGDPMADYVSKFAHRYRKGIAATSIGIRQGAHQSTNPDASVPTITSGTGAPAATTEPNGSVYLRTNGSSGADSIYMRIAGAWVALAG